jgi:hypothetical protein
LVFDQLLSVDVPFDSRGFTWFLIKALMQGLQDGEAQVPLDLGTKMLPILQCHR